MDSKVLKFIKNNRIGVLTTLLPDGKPHSATLHFASSDDPFYFVFWTGKNSRKCKHFVVGEKYASSLVIGFSEEEFITIQMEGDVLVVGGTEIDEVYKTYRSKFGGSEKYSGTENDVLLKFVPAWWRYTEFKPKKVIIESE